MAVILLQHRDIQRLATLAALLGLLALACTGAEPTPTPTATPSPTPTATASPTPTATSSTSVGPLPQPGGTLVIAARARVPSYDVHQEFSAALATGGPGLVYSRLLRLKGGAAVEMPSLQVECELCETWEALDGGKTYLFHLRPEARWQDAFPLNGRPVTAQDVVFSLQRQRTPGWPNAGLLRAIQSVEAEGDSTVRVTLVAPEADFPLALADGHSKIVAPEVVALNGDLTQGPNIGSGPWLWKDDRNGFYTLQRNPDYFEDGLPFLDRLEVQVIPDEDTRITAFRTDLLDVEELSAAEWADFSPRHPEVQSLLYRASGAGMELAINTQVPPFNQLPVRQAFFRALDPWGDIDAAWAGQAYVSLGMPVGEAGWLLSRQELESYFNDPAEAQLLLQQAAVNLPISFTFMVGEFGDAYLQHAQRIAQALEAVGFQPTIQPVDLGTFAVDVWFGGDYTVFLGALAPVNTPNSYLLSILHSQGAWNTHGFGDSQLDVLIEQQSVQLDPLIRQAQAQGIQELAFGQAFRFMPATQVQRWAWWPRVQGFAPNFAAFESFHWARVWLEP